MANSYLPPPFRLDELPVDVLLQICDHLQPSALLCLSVTSYTWRQFCCTEVWPRRIATLLSVRSVYIPRPTQQYPAPHEHQSLTTARQGADGPPDPNMCTRILRTLEMCPPARMLCLCVHLSPTDNLTSLSLTYAISRHEICRANSLYSEHQLAARTHLYIPLATEADVVRVTKQPSSAHTACIVRDHALSNKIFPVIECRPQQGGASGDPICEISNFNSRAYAPSMSLRIFRAPLSHYRIRFGTVANDQPHGSSRGTMLASGLVLGSYFRAPV